MICRIKAIVRTNSDSFNATVNTKEGRWCFHRYVRKLHGKTHYYFLPNLVIPTNVSLAYGLPEKLLVYGGADIFLGNSILIPTWLFTGTGVDIKYTMGHIPGVKYVHMLNQTHLAEVTIGSDTYKLFRLSLFDSTYTLGVAILK